MSGCLNDRMHSRLMLAWLRTASLFNQLAEVADFLLIGFHNAQPIGHGIQEREHLADTIIQENDKQSFS